METGIRRAVFWRLLLWHGLFIRTTRVFISKPFFESTNDRARSQIWYVTIRYDSLFKGKKLSLKDQVVCPFTKSDAEFYKKFFVNAFINYRKRLNRG